MAALHLLPPPQRSFPFFLNPIKLTPLSSTFHLQKPQNPKPLRAATSSQDEAIETPKRRGRKKGTTASSSISAPEGVVETPKPTRRGRKKGTTTSPSAQKTRTKLSRKENQVEEEAEVTTREPDEDSGDDNDDLDFPFYDPPLICCFGATQKEFIPTVRVSEHQMHPDIYSEWKMRQWDPPEFARAPGGSPSNVAISHVRLGGRAAFMGKVGRDEYGEELVLTMNKEKVQTRAIKFDSNARTACSYMRIKFENGKTTAEMVKESPEDSLLSSELNVAVLKEVV